MTVKLLTEQRLEFLSLKGGYTGSTESTLVKMPHMLEITSWLILINHVCLNADPGVASLIPARSHTFVEIDHEIITTVILFPSAESFKKGCCQLQAKLCAQSTG